MRISIRGWLIGQIHQPKVLHCIFVDTQLMLLLWPKRWHCLWCWTFHPNCLLWNVHFLKPAQSVELGAPSPSRSWTLTVQLHPWSEFSTPFLCASRTICCSLTKPFTNGNDWPHSSDKIKTAEKNLIQHHLLVKCLMLLHAIRECHIYWSMQLHTLLCIFMKVTL